MLQILPRRTWGALTLFVAILISLISNVSAAELSFAELPDDALGTQHIIKVVFALGITLFAIWLISTFAKKARWGRAFEGRHLQVVDSLAIGARDRIMLIEVDGQKIVVASTPGQIRALHTFPGESKPSFEEVLADSNKPVEQLTK